MVKTKEPKQNVKPKTTLARKQGANGKAKFDVKPIVGVPSLCAELQDLARQRKVYLKSRIMNENRLTGIVAGSLGYSSEMSEAEGKRYFSRARDAIASGQSGNGTLDTVIRVHCIGIDELRQHQDLLETEMEGRASQLPAAAWLRMDEQRGFGLLSLAKIIGETGDLCKYPNPAKVWRRMGCAPFSSDGKTLMGATWRSKREGTLSSDEWTEYGYPPSRRSIMHVIGEVLVKQNGPVKSRLLKDGTERPAKPCGPYRARYDEVKAEYPAKHPDRVVCSKCTGTGKAKRGGKCSNCKGTGRAMKRAHMHSMLLMEKLLLKNLWIEWNGHPAIAVL